MDARHASAVPHVPLLSPPILYTGTQWLVIAGLVVIGLGLKALVTWWVWSDAQARGANAKAWAIACAIVTTGTALVWLIMRPRPPPRRTTQSPTPPRPAPAPEPAAADPYMTGFGTSEPDPRVSGLPAEPDHEATPAHAEVTVTCPRCQNRLRVVRNPAGPTPLKCDRCGATGRL